jgi:hypothetical protein
VEELRPIASDESQYDVAPFPKDTQYAQYVFEPLPRAIALHPKACTSYHNAVDELIALTLVPLETNPAVTISPLIYAIPVAVGNQYCEALTVV